MLQFVKCGCWYRIESYHLWYNSSYRTRLWDDPESWVPRYQLFYCKKLVEIITSSKNTFSYPNSITKKVISEIFIRNQKKTCLNVSKKIYFDQFTIIIIWYTSFRTLNWNLLGNIEMTSTTHMFSVVELLFWNAFELLTFYDVQIFN